MRHRQPDSEAAAGTDGGISGACCEAVLPTRRFIMISTSSLSLQPKEPGVYGVETRIPRPQLTLPLDDLENLEGEVSCLLALTI